MRRKGNVMPLMNVKLIDGVFDAAQKRETVEKLTEAWSASKARTCGR